MFVNTCLYIRRSEALEAWLVGGAVDASEVHLDDFQPVSLHNVTVESFDTCLHGLDSKPTCRFSKDCEASLLGSSPASVHTRSVHPTHALVGSECGKPAHFQAQVESLRLSTHLFLYNHVRCEQGLFLVSRRARDQPFPRATPMHPRRSFSAASFPSTAAIFRLQELLCVSPSSLAKPSSAGRVADIVHVVRDALRNVDVLGNEPYHGPLLSRSFSSLLRFLCVQHNGCYDGSNVQRGG